MALIPRCEQRHGCSDEFALGHVARLVYWAVGVAGGSEAFAAFFCGLFTAAYFVAFTGAFFAVAFSATAGAVFTAAAFFAAHRFFKAATMFALPALLSFLCGFDGAFVAGAGGSDSPRILAHRSCWASFIRLRAAAENFRRLIVGVSGLAAAIG